MVVLYIMMYSRSQRPESETQTQAVIEQWLYSHYITCQSCWENFTETIYSSAYEYLFPNICKHYAWLGSCYGYFDPEVQKMRVAIHDYQQTEIREMRRMDNTKRVDSLKLPLKSYNDALAAFKHILISGLEGYRSKFVTPFPADWPMQFFMQQLVYNTILYTSPLSATTSSHLLAHYIFP